ncbi:phage regulatory CII family protein [Chelativorans sp. YIM 93263]|uniref:phage regulatory CII family protein n=1 Tax=Chelativorans sp. YIM 93263 TaxID=2906648 RepID=UPI002377F89C|nr:phage regulatory CII family protein [Chelativorans sp. YIM 93263]
MIPNANARLYRIKAAQRDLIAAAGGIERVAEIVGYGKSTVGRWNHGDSPDLMPLDAVWMLEAETSSPLVTSALAELSGRRLTDLQRENETAADIMRGYADLCTKAGELMATMANALADGRVTPAEATAYDRRLAELSDLIAACRKQAASVRGEGGFAVVNGGAE